MRISDWSSDVCSSDLPDDGYIVDRARVFAFMRQESAFNARAMSPVGAAGLMQLMPNTAGAVAGDRSLRSKRSRHKLFAPEYNIDLGQRYLQTLLKKIGRAHV